MSKNDTGCPFQRLDDAVLCEAARSTKVHACVPSRHRMAPTLANQILARTFFRFRRASACVPSRWKVLSGEFRRRPTELAIKFRKSDRVGRRGLFEPREDFSRLHTNAFLWIDSVAVFVTDSVCVPSRWKVLAGEFRRRPTELAIKFRKSDRVGRRGLFEPREDFSRLNTHVFQWLFQSRFSLRTSSSAPPIQPP